jgi:hypothetical protein
VATELPKLGNAIRQRVFNQRRSRDGDDTFDGLIADQLIGIANMCQHLHCLPGPGGLLDQDSFLVYGMDLVVDAQNAKQEMDQAVAEQQQKKQRLGAGR